MRLKLEEEAEKIEILHSLLKVPKQTIRWGKIPTPIDIYLTPTSDIIDSSHPARYIFDGPFQVAHPFLNPRGPTEVYIWDETPKDFREILLYHELKEMELFWTGVPFAKKHEYAVIFHMAYARTFLSDEGLNDFIAWQSAQGDYVARAWSPKPLRIISKSSN